MKLHLGCWHRHIPGFVHIDLCEGDHIDYKSDIGNLNFIKDSTVSYIYCSHALEYKDYEDAKEVIREWNRVLKKDGLVRIAVPDFDQLIWLYNETGRDLDKIIGPLYGKMTINNDTKLYHRTTYNYKKIKNLLESSGFYNIKRYDWRNTEHSQIDDHSQAYYPHMDKENGTLISLNVEAKKDNGL